MDPNLLAQFAQQAAPGRPPPTMLPPGMAPGSAGMMMPQAMPPSPASAPVALPSMPAMQLQSGPPGAGAPSQAPPAMPPGLPMAALAQGGRSVIRPAGIPPHRSMAGAAAAGRGGDTMMAHMTPGEIAVPPQVQTPEVLATLNRAFAQMGANPTSYQAGHPDEKINPETGAPEFGFFDALLPLGLGLLGSTFLGPGIGGLLGAGGLGLGESTAGIIGGALGGGIGTTAGNLLTGHPLDESLTRGALGAAGSGIGGAIGSAFGTGPTPVAGLNATTMAPSEGFDALANATGGESGATLGQQAGTASATDVLSKPNWFSKFINDQLSAKSIGSGIGGYLAGTYADSLFPPAAPKTPPEAQLGPPGRVSDFVGNGSPALSGYVNAGAPQFPGAEYLKNYGRRPGFNFFPVG